eukprot:TRINITY_DN21704_c0_g1_i5.p1 TRINITY_DN21704_c0_g1~~TRINITY_DN21704_c0_g1_i5.p1  ORF type:complete len:444 (-),score=74.64 TRINITY_DN21704_c0_g1_i5:317-1648(-)
MGAHICKPQPCCAEAVMGIDPEPTPSLSMLDAASVKASLPKDLSPVAANTVRETAPLIATHGEEIARATFRRLLESHPELVEFFNLTHQESGRQQKAFAAAIGGFAASVDDLADFKSTLDLIAAKHCALVVKPHHYLFMHEVLMGAIGEVLGTKMTQSIGIGWSESILYLSGLLIDREEALYQEAKERNGGWRGFRKFLVKQRDQVADDVVLLTLRPADAHGVYFDFIPGQFVSVKVDPCGGNGFVAPRHYTVVSPPGMPYLQICVKRLPKGIVSNFLHDNANQGQALLLSPPFGTFTSRLALQNSYVNSMPPTTPGSSGIVLLSAGIGVTPMLALMQDPYSKVVMASHVDKDEEAFPLRQQYVSNNCFCEVHFTRKAGRPPKDFAAQIAHRVGTQHDWYICGPASFMVDVMRSLVRVGVDSSKIHFEVFGPQLCPFAAAGQH